MPLVPGLTFDGSPFGVKSQTLSLCSNSNLLFFTLSPPASQPGTPNSSPTRHLARSSQGFCPFHTVRLRAISTCQVSAALQGSALAPAFPALSSRILLALRMTHPGSLTALCSRLAQRSPPLSQAPANPFSSSYIYALLLLENYLFYRVFVPLRTFIPGPSSLPLPVQQTQTHCPKAVILTLGYTLEPKGDYSRIPPPHSNGQMINGWMEEGRKEGGMLCYSGIILSCLPLPDLVLGGQD